MAFYSYHCHYTATIMIMILQRKKLKYELPIFKNYTEGEYTILIKQVPFVKISMPTDTQKTCI